MANKNRNVFEKIAEGILTLSGLTTSIIILLIVFFLFKEGFQIFNASPLEDHTIVTVNKANKVSSLSSDQLKLIYDQEITNWKDVGGEDKDILLFTMEDISTYYSEEQIGSEMENLPILIDSLIQKESGIIASFNDKYKFEKFQGKVINVAPINAGSFLGGHQWYPTAKPSALMGLMPLLLGTLWVSFLAILFALPFGLATAIYLAEIADLRTRNIVKPIIELLAGIPSVVYGFFGLVVIVPMIQKVFNLPVGETGLAGSIVLCIMALPTIITISEDFMRTTPRAMREASLALGASKWQTIYKVVIPYSISGIAAAVILGIGRAIGETMAVLMVTGNAAVMPKSILEPLRTIPATIAAELGEAPQGGLHFKALFALGCILFIITFCINLLVDFITKKRKA